MLVELSIVEQRYHAVMEVISGAPVTEVARRYGVSRQSVHTWLGKYREGGLAALADHPTGRIPSRGSSMPISRRWSAAGEFSNGVWGFFVPALPEA